ncbi:MAG TPA: PEP-utilizing enzyme [Dehalococcoidia bacterium]|nr:PEP-utilizing enzyme [Dehalococcoidia bacterium]
MSPARKKPGTEVKTTRPARGGTSWDTLAHPSYNIWGTGNVEEVLPGISRPLPCDISAAFMYLYAKGLLDIANAHDLVDLAELPRGNVFGFFGGRWAVNIAWLGAYAAVYSPDQESDWLTQFVRGDEEATKSGVADNVERARRTRRVVERTWERSVERADKERVVAARARRAMLRRNLSRDSEAQLLGRVDKNVDLTARIFIRHSQSSIGGGEYVAQLGGFLDKELPGHPEEWTTTLTSALQGVLSAEPIREIWKLSRLARRLRTVAADFRADDVSTLAAKLSDPPTKQWEEFAAAYGKFIDEWGFRGQKETDPSVPDWREDPSFVLGALKADVDLPARKDPSKREERAAMAREKLEKKIITQLPRRRRAEFRKLLKDSQVLVKARELTKANWAETCRAFRPPLLELGTRFAERGLIAERDDIFFLRLDEVREAVAGDLGSRAAKGRITSRKAEYEALHEYGIPVTFSLPIELERVKHARTKRSVTLHGMGVSPGVAKGKARIIMNAEAGDAAHIEPGEILVAPYTDAPWTPLFWPAAGVVVERGGMLSHASTVAREFGIPAVVAVPQATEKIKQGTMVTVDGNTGTVKVG